MIPCLGSLRHSQDPSEGRRRSLGHLWSPEHKLNTNLKIKRVFIGQTIKVQVSPPPYILAL